MTYKMGPFYVTTLSMEMPLFDIKGKLNRHPNVLVGLAVTTTKTADDYHYISHQLKVVGKLQTLVYGTDGEPALENAFETTFPIEGFY